MGARLAVAGLGIYVIAVWAAVGMTAYSWFSSSDANAQSVATAQSMCLSECGLKSAGVMERSERVLPAK